LRGSGFQPGCREELLETLLSSPDSITDLLKKGNVHMRIAIPTTGDCLNPHFGHCEKFVIIDVDPKTREVIATTEALAPEHQPGLLPVWLKERGVTHVIAGGMGAHARSLLSDASIEVITGASVESPAVLVRNYLNGTLVSVDQPCDHVCSH
jgi:predicted Fe-Mo cluster-binding NifX family protein